MYSNIPRGEAPLLACNQNIKQDIPQYSVEGFPLLRSESTYITCKQILHVNIQAISAEELGKMSKNNLRGITLVRGPVWGIHSLTLIISFPE